MKTLPETVNCVVRYCINTETSSAKFKFCFVIPLDLNRSVLFVFLTER